MIEARGSPDQWLLLWLRVGLAATAAVALAVVTGVLELPSVGAFLADLSDALGIWAYVLVPALAFFETAAFLGLVVPGETAVLVGGVVAERGEVSLPILIALVWMLSVAGEVSAFLLGRRLGGPFLRRHAPRLRVKEEHLDRLDRLFARHGGKTIVIARFVGVLRAFTPFVAGTSGMALRRFLPYSAAAALAWAALFTLLGYAFSSSVPTVGDNVTRISVAVLVLAGLALLVRRSRRSVRAA
jgi:membrane-associated protein